MKKGIIATIRKLFRKRREIPDIPEDWIITGGEGVTVCVIDSGLPDHPALAGTIDAGASRNFVWGEDIADQNGHATAVCGVLNYWAPMARIVCVKAAGADGSGATTALRLAFEEAAGMKPDIVCCSIGVDAGASKCLHALGILEAQGIPVICSAGNTGAQVRYPGRFAQTIAVGACDARGRRAWFTPSGAEVDCLYPGMAVRTPWLHGGYAINNGTSLAAPCAAAVAALWLAWVRRGGDTMPAGAELVAECRRALIQAGA